MKKSLLLEYFAFISFVGFSQNIVSYTNLFDSHTLLYCYSPKTTNSHPKETIPIAADIPFTDYSNYSAYGTGSMPIYNANSDKILRQPILIDDGFDPKNNRKYKTNVESNEPYCVHSIGLFWNFSLVLGITYKYRLTQHLSLATNFAPKSLITGKVRHDKVSHIMLALIELSEKVLYQFPFTNTKKYNCQWLFGGGINSAVQPFFPIVWEIGVNSFVDIEFISLKKHYHYK